jgi:peptidyl-prolyl cis-trans isomerase B (cyclophilin B)
LAIPGLVSLQCLGTTTNGLTVSSLRFVFLLSRSWLNGKHVVFGRVLEGMNVARRIESGKTGRSDRPVKEVKIVRSGKL